MDDSLLVIVGQWACVDDSQWKFVVSTKQMARCIRLRSDMLFVEFLDQIKKTFSNDIGDCQVALSFWYPQDALVFSQGKTSPIAVESDCEFQLFKDKRREIGVLNMYLSFCKEDVAGTFQKEVKLLASLVDEDFDDPQSDTNIAGIDAVFGTDLARVDDDCNTDFSGIDDDLLIQYVDQVEAEYRRKHFSSLVCSFRGLSAMDMNLRGHQVCKPMEHSDVSGELVLNHVFSPTLADKSHKGVLDTHVTLQPDGYVSSRWSSRSRLSSPTGGCNLSSNLGHGEVSAKLGLNQVFTPRLSDLSIQVALDTDDEERSEDCVPLIRRGRQRISPRVGEHDLISNVCHGVDHFSTGMSDSGFGSWIDLPDGGHESCCITNRLDNVNAPDLLEYRLHPPQIFQQSTWEIGESSKQGCNQPSLLEAEPIGFSLGIDDLESSQKSSSDFVGCVSDPLGCASPEADGGSSEQECVDNFSVHGESRLLENFFTLPSVATEISENDILLRDAPPEYDNLRGPPPSERHMDLKMAEDAVYVGRIFASKKQLHKTLSFYALKRLFSFRFTKSDQKRVIANCFDKNCCWRVYAVACKGSENFEVRTVHLEHSCDVAARSRYGEKATSKVLAELLQSKFASGRKPPRACDLPAIVLSELKVNISYMKAWYAKELALSTARGNEEENYHFLSTYLHLLRTTNPETLTEMVTKVDKNGNTQFKFLFFAMAASIAGYPYLRKVIVIDRTTMKGKYKGCLVAASGQDGNMQIFPLAFAVVDGENEASWAWFFKNLKQFVPDDKDLLFVSDRHAAIYSGIRKVYPLAQHGACAVHLVRNVSHRFKSEGLAAVVSKAARSYTIGDFRYWWREIEKRSPRCADYLLNIGLPHWTLSHCPGMRYNIMSSNISESLNAAMQKAVDYPIVSIIESLREMLMTWFSCRRAKARRARTRCTPEIESLLIDNLEEASACAVLSASERVYQVNDAAGCVFTVDFEKSTCSCRLFDILLLPCPHALAATGVAKIDLYSLIGDCYRVLTWRKLYQGVIMPVPRVSDVDVPERVSAVSLNPPTTKRPSGRPRKRRIPSRGELHYPNKKKRVGKCGRCFGSGHNRKTCSAPI